MPIFETFDGISISVFSRDHLPPHCHARHAEHEALIAIRTADVIAGYLPAKALKKVISYVSIDENKQELLATFYQLNPQIPHL